MRELLIELDGEVEPGRGPAHPAFGDLRPRLAVKRRVDFDRVEPFGVEGELVEPAPAVPRPRVENPVPRAASGGVVPARRADPRVHGYNEYAGAHHGTSPSC